MLLFNHRATAQMDSFGFWWLLARLTGFDV
jgi:hypothetical protein